MTDRIPTENVNEYPVVSTSTANVLANSESGWNGVARSIDNDYSIEELNTPAPVAIPSPVTYAYTQNTRQGRHHFKSYNTFAMRKTKHHNVY